MCNISQSPEDKEQSKLLKCCVKIKENTSDNGQCWYNTGITGVPTQTFSKLLCTAVFWLATACSLAGKYWSFGGTHHPHFYPKDGVDMFLWNVGNCIQH